MFSVATGEVEQKINAGQIDESRRAIDLLAKFDANNYTLTILRNKLDLKKKQMDRDQEKRDQDKALAANAGKPNAATPGATTAPAASTPAEAKPATAEAAPKPAATTVATAKPAAAPAAPAGETRAAVPISQPAPRYPAEAFRSRQEGWVEVAFTVTAEGSVKDGSVVGANPPRLFNAAALRGITDWKFQPRLENGQAVEQQVRTRIEFKLPDR
jgi:protein TonB